MLAHAPAPLTAARAATTWRPDPTGLLLSLLLITAYLVCARRVADRGDSWPAGRTAGFVFGGAGSLLLATCSFLGVYAPVLRWVAVIQAATVMLVCPLLFGLGSPVALLKAARPGRAMPRAGVLTLRTLGAPGIGALIVLAVLPLLVFTSWLGWAQQGTGPHAVTVVALLSAGLPLALPVTDRGAQISSLAYAAMLGLGVIEFLLDAVPGMVLRLDNHLLAAGHWLTVNRSWGPTPLADQHLAGDWLWSLAEIGDLPFIIILAVAWIRSDTREATAEDALLDQIGAEWEIPGQPGMMRPWWQTADDRPHSDHSP